MSAIYQREQGPVVKIFISYSNDDRATADALEVGFRQEGHDVFFDRSDLAAGEAFHARIRAEIAAADLFVFIISPSSVRPDCYAMTELSLARRHWPDPSGAVIPVLARPTPMEQIPPYVAAVTFVQGGNTVAETIGVVARIANERRAAEQSRHRLRIAAITVGVVVLGAAVWKTIVALQPGQVDLRPCYLSLRVNQGIGPSGIVLDTFYEGESNSFQIEEGAASIHVGPLRTLDAAWSFTLRSATGETIALDKLRGCPAGPISFSLNKDLDVTFTPR